MDRILPDKQFFYVGTLGTSSARLPNSLDTLSNTNCIYVKEIVLTNMTANDVTVTLTTAESSPSFSWPVVVSANDQVVRTYAQGWDFPSGVKASASSGSAIHAQIWGYQKV